MSVDCSQADFHDTDAISDLFKIIGSIPSQVGQVKSLQNPGNSSCFDAVPQESCFELDLGALGLQGTIPTELGRLQAIYQVDFAKNSLSGRIPTELGQLQALSTLILRRNCLSGNIPLEISRLVLLRDLHLHINRLVGSIHTQVGQLSRLNRLNVKGNMLTGSIPSELGNLHSKEDMDLRDNSLGGSIPAELALNWYKHGWGNELALSGNSLEGSIPNKLLSSNIAAIDVSKNSLEGAIPSEIGGMQFLQRAMLNRNMISGIIPTEVSKCLSMNILIVIENRIVGSTPSELGDARDYEYVGIARNSLEGSLPSELGKLPFMLNVAHNGLQGSLPGGISFNHNFYGHQNDFTGTLPENFSMFGSLTLHGNQIGGSVPAMHPLHDDDDDELGFQLLTLHGNFLTCKLPEIDSQLMTLSKSGTSYTVARSSVLLGNRFTGPLPGWVPKAERDPLLYRSPQPYYHFLLGCLLGLLLLSGWIICILGRESRSFLVRFFSSARRGCLSREYARWVNKSIAKMTALSLCCMLPICTWGGQRYACPEMPPKLSHMDGRVAECFAGGYLVLHYVLAFRALKHTESEVFAKEEQIGTREAVPFMHRCMSSLLWIVIVLCFSIPAVAYTLTTMLPKKNVLVSRIGPSFFKLIHYSSVAIGVLLSRSLFPWVTKSYASWCGMNRESFKVWGKALAFWIIPSIVVVVVHENCFGFWRRLWSVCYIVVDHPRGERGIFDVLVLSPLKAFGYALTTSEMCETASVRRIAKNGKCSRAIIETMAGLLTQKARTEAFVMPILRLGLFYSSSLLSRSRLRDACLSRALRQLAVKCQSRNGLIESVSMILELAITWGPLAPALHPLLLCAAIGHLASYEIGTSIFGLFDSKHTEIEIQLCERACRRSLIFVVSLGFLITLAMWLHMKFDCIGMLCVAPLVLILGIRYSPSGQCVGDVSSPRFSLQMESEMTHVQAETYTQSNDKA